MAQGIFRNSQVDFFLPRLSTAFLDAMAAELKAEIEALVAKISDKAAGQGALESLGKIAEEKGRPAEPFLVAAFPKILDASNDKSKNVKDAAVATSKTIMGILAVLASFFCWS